MSRVVSPVSVVSGPCSNFSAHRPMKLGMVGRKVEDGASRRREVFYKSRGDPFRPVFVRAEVRPGQSGVRACDQLFCLKAVSVKWGKYQVQVPRQNRADVSDRRHRSWLPEVPNSFGGVGKKAVRAKAKR